MGTLFRAAAVAIVKNEAPYIAEWIEHYAALGIEHVYIFDNNSEDDLAAVLRPYLVQGRATLLTWPGWPEQMSAYNYAIRMFGHACDWMTLLDIDEFIQLDAPGTLPDYWDGLGDADQVLMSWMLFGAGGHEEKPEGLVIESYRHRLAAPSPVVKCAVRPGAVVSAEVHHCVTRDRRTVDALGRPVAEAFRLAEPLAGPLCVNHYITKSHAEWARKVARGQADGTIWRKEEEFRSYQGDVLDERAAARGAAVRAGLARTAAAMPGHVSHNRSALSELTPSRRWMLQAVRRLRAAGEALDGAWRLVPEVDVVLLASAGPEAGDAGAFAALVADTGAAALTPEAFGRPFVTFTATSETGGVLETLVEGRDAAGHPHSVRRRIAIAPGTTIGAAILSARTMTVARFEAVLDGGAVAAAGYSFV